MDKWEQLSVAILAFAFLWDINKSLHLLLKKMDRLTEIVWEIHKTPRR
jgi:hypothetical protein